MTVTLQHLRRWMPSGLPSEVSLDSHSVLGIGTVGGIGLGTLCIHILHLIILREGLFITILGTVCPMLLSILLIIITLFISREYDKRIFSRIGSWCLVATLILVTVSVVSIIYQQSKGVTMVDHLFVVTNHVTVGALIGTLTGIYDGERHQRGLDLKTERERAQRLSNRLTILNRILRHDIRNCVTVIQGQATLLINENIDPVSGGAKIREKASELEEVSDKACQVEQLVEKGPIDLNPVDIASIAREEATKLNEEYPEAKFHLEMPDSIQARAPSLIGTAIRELLENAIEHNDVRRPRVEVTISSSGSQLQADGGNPAVTMRICDNGPGIPEHVLEVLERGKETALQHTDGIGLWLVRWVVDVSDGAVRFEANDPRGSIVEIDLPLEGQ